VVFDLPDFHRHNTVDLNSVILPFAADINPSQIIQAQKLILQRKAAPAVVAATTIAVPSTISDIFIFDPNWLVELKDSFQARIKFGQSVLHWWLKQSSCRVLILAVLTAHSLMEKSNLFKNSTGQ
jgi:hypothetical protein